VESDAWWWLLSLIQFGGWITVLVATFQVGHWGIFGVAQVMDFIQDRPYTFNTSSTLSADYYKSGWPVAYQGIWRYARHPDFFGFIVAFWATPTMTVGHLMFAAGLTTYIMIGIFLLELNFKELYGRVYENYVATRSKVIPWFAPAVVPNGDRSKEGAEPERPVSQSGAS
jgi:protein-S-isoprenylcysteine O-methyltransferase Ste14